MKQCKRTRSEQQCNWIQFGRQMYFFFSNYCNKSSQIPPVMFSGGDCLECYAEEPRGCFQAWLWLVSCGRPWGLRVRVRRTSFPWVGVAEGQVLLKLFPASSQPPASQPITMCSPQCANIPGAGESRFNGNAREHETWWCRKLAVNTGKQTLSHSSVCSGTGGRKSSLFHLNRS